MLKLRLGAREVFLLLFILTLYHRVCSENIDDYQKLAKSVRTLIKDWNSKHTDTNERDVMILNLGANSDMLNTIVKFIPRYNPIIVLHDGCNIKHNNLKLGKPAFIVILSKYIHKHEVLLSNCVDTSLWSSLANVIVIPQYKINQDDVINSCNNLVTLKMLNSVVLSFYSDEDLFIFQCDYLADMYSGFQYTNDTDTVFPDRLMNMNGYEYKVFFNSKYDPFLRKKDILVSKDTLYLATMFKRQNATATTRMGNVDVKRVANILDSVDFDLLVGAANVGGNLLVNKHFHKVNTYDVNGYCFLVPIPPAYGFLRYVLTPFDSTTWLLICISVGVGALIWHLLSLSNAQNSNSAGYFVYGVVSNFLLQAIPFRRNRLMQKILLQLFVFMMMILGNAYKGLLTSILTSSKESPRMTTIQELVGNGYSFYVDELFNFSNHENLKMLENRLIIDNKTTQQFSEWIMKYLQRDSKKIPMTLCNEMNDILDADIDNTTKIKDLYYILPERYYSFYEHYLTTRWSPFGKKLSELSLRIFESGIKQFWEVLLRKTSRPSKNDNRDDGVIRLHEFLSLLKVWIVGMIVAAGVFVLEVIWNWITKKNVLRSARRRYRNNRVFIV